MNKSLEALESLISMYINIQNGTNMISNTSKILEELNLIKQDLERLEEIDKAQEVEFDNLKFTENENKYQTSIRVLKEAFIALGKSDIANTCWFKYLEQLENENQDLKELQELNKQGLWNLKQENQKLKKAIADEIDILLARRFDAYECDDYQTYNLLNTIIEELEEVLRECQN